MKAEVQYNDFVGTAAADISDHTSLEDFIGLKGVDTDRFNPIGVEFYSGYSDSFLTSIICIDNERSNSVDKFLVNINFELNKDEFFDLFKRFNVVIFSNYGGYENLEVKESLDFDDID
ncbi:hypothetical protein ACLI09_02295 [Flavobacterium sp. RHBU_24]|uniref:hypothetical protein n=1 Tax=Flavobacterium sp. RHBU_24 TaxID=3391185 RepID=UPI0039849513